MSTIRNYSSVEIRYVSTLDYYDGILLFEAQDSIGGAYVATIAEEGSERDKYLMVRCRLNELRLFKQGEYELRELFQRSAQFGWYRAYLRGLKEPLAVEYQSADAIPDDELPEAGIRLDSVDVPHEVTRAAGQDTSVILQVVLDPPERASAGAIGTFLNGLQQFLAHIGDYSVSRNVRRAEVSKPNPRSYDMAVTSLEPGSAKITLERPYDADVDGTHPLSEALAVMHELLSAPADSQFVEKMIDTYGFRVAQSYLDVLRCLQSQRTGLAYTWASPQPRRSTFGYSHAFLNLDKVDWLASELGWVVGKVADSYVESSQKLIGTLVMVDLWNRRWGLEINKPPGKVIRGYADSGLQGFSGLTLNERYEFDCLVRVPQLPRKRTLYLLRNIAYYERPHDVFDLLT